MTLALILQCAEDEITSRPYPRLKTLPVSNITSEGAKFNAEIIFRGGFEVISYGFVWGENEYPSLENSDRVIYSGNTQKKIFSKDVGTTLKNEVSYFVRAFVKTNEYIVYGESVQFISEGGITPQLLSVDPYEAHRGDTVLINGVGFSYLKNNIYFDEYEAQIISNSDSLLKVIVPEELTSTFPKIEVELFGRKSELIDKFKLIGPTLSEISSDHGIIGREIITIKSDAITNLAGNYSIEINGKEFEIEITNISAGSISFYIPPSSPVGEFTINLINDSVRFINPLLFNFISPWVRKSDLPGNSFGSYGSAFTIDDKIYFANSKSTDDKDFWQYDPVKDSWQQKADIPGPPYTMRVAFTIGHKVYIGTGDCVAYYCTSGRNPSSSVLSYDTETDEWEQLSYIIPDPYEVNYGVYGAIGFSVDDVGYMFGGLVNWKSVNHYDYWKYDYIQDRWFVINEFDEFKNFTYLINPTGFVLNDKIYIGLGQTDDLGRNNYKYTSKFWEYNPQNDTWKRISDFPGQPRSGAIGFTKNGMGYIGLGYNSNQGTFNDFWRYDSVEDKWRRIADLPSSPREGAVSVEFNDRVFIGFGTNENDLWEFK